jgi:hypothetical protein
MNVHASIGMPGALRDLGDRSDVVAMCAGGAVWANLQFLVRDLLREAFDSGCVCSACARQADVGGVDA